MEAEPLRIFRASPAGFAEWLDTLPDDRVFSRSNGNTCPLASWLRESGQWPKAHVSAWHVWTQEDSPGLGSRSDLQWLSTWMKEFITIWEEEGVIDETRSYSVQFRTVGEARNTIRRILSVWE